MKIHVHSTQAGRRFDKFIRMHMVNLSLSQVYMFIRNGTIRCNDKKKAIHYRIQSGDTVSFPDTFHLYLRDPQGQQKKSKKGEAHSHHSPPPYNVLWQNEHLVAVHKPPATTIDTSFIDKVQSYALSVAPHAYRPHPVHQLDTNTSGVLLVARSVQAAQVFSALFRERHIKKYYLSIVEGRISKPQHWYDVLDRDYQSHTSYVQSSASENHPQCAITHVYPLQYSKANNLSLVRCMIETGKTHQIRAQGIHHGHPIVGDKKYKSRWSSRNYLLHAKTCIIPMNACTPGIKIEAPLSNAQVQIAKDLGLAIL